MSRDAQLKERWEQLVTILSDRFSQGEDLDLDAIIYLIGIQELGKLHREFKKDEKLKHLPVLMVTAEARKEDIVMAAQQGAAGYIVKPFTKATLEDKVNHILTKNGLK